ncbi:serine hydrolase [Ktedonosporobacter rubrisoli]|uniref:Serine hydrolase n=1 Tax=Ktedonosporobacter rubrisoli TaxID=2509675 RepID=A0A4V0YZS9_KTERU|nr:serine hydrolase [Ktedonosporobacter rubrisoli]QBD80781.1 serine hydrolase [Ktedonosporobacter rubrisoli]
MSLQQEEKPDVLQGVGEFVQEVIKDHDVPGLALAIVKDGKTLLSQGFGKRNVAEQLAVTPETLFAIGSSSKAFTAMALAMLVDEGKLEWSAPVKNYIPEFKLYDQVATEHLSVRDLLIHDSGLPRHDAFWYNNPALTRKGVIERLPYLEPTHELRTTWQYQNLMYATAGYLVEVVDGRSWEDFVKERIFEPLGMSSSNFSVHDSQKTPDFALPYKKIKDEVKLVDFYDRFQAVGPAGSINSNVTDMSKWVNCMLNKGKYGDGEQRLVSEAQFEQVVTPQMVCPPLPTLFKKYPETFHWSYAMGWFATSYRGHVMLQHGGNIDGFSALVAFLPDDQIGIIALTNLNGNFAHEAITFSLCDRLLGLSDTPWNERFTERFAELKAQEEKMKQETAEERVPDAPPSHPLSAYAGTFEHPGYGSFSIELDGESLKGSYNDNEYTFAHHHYDVFLVSTEAFEISLKGSFGTNLKGQIETFSLGIGLEPGVKPIVFTRAADKRMQDKSFLEQFVGEYELMGLTMTVALKGEKSLLASIPEQPAFELLPYQGTEFHVKGQVGVSLEFKLDEAGQVSGAVLSQPQGTLRASKKG